MFIIIIIFSLGADRYRRDFFFRASLTSFHTHASLLTFFVGFSFLFHSCCSHARVFAKTLLPEFHISHSHTEWYLIIFTTRVDILGRRVACRKLTIIIKINK